MVGAAAGRYLDMTSIRGRFAVGLTIAKATLREHGLLRDPSAKLLIDQFATFTNSNCLDDWETLTWLLWQQMVDQPGITAVTVSNKVDEANQRYFDQVKRQPVDPARGPLLPINVLPIGDYDALIQFIRGLPELVVKVMTLCQEIGEGNLYAGYESYVTLKPAVRIVELTGARMNWPTIAAKYPATAEHGWGYTFDFDSFGFEMKR